MSDFNPVRLNPESIDAERDRDGQRSKDRDSSLPDPDPG